MGGAGTIMLMVVLFGSPVALIVVAMLWRKAAKGRTQAETALIALEPATQARIEAAHAETAEELQRLKDRLFGLMDLDKEKERVAHEVEMLRATTRVLEGDYRQKKEVYDRLGREVAIFDERLAFAEMGVYEPHFDFGDSETYKVAITNTRENQKRMISDKTAVTCTTAWTVDGSQAKGQTMINRNIRLTLRAFNGEADAAIANTRWNNVNAMEERILRAKEQVDKLNVSNAIYINMEFLKLKLEELYLNHEYREKKKSEREERAEELRLARDEQRLLRDLEEAREQEQRYDRLLAQAKTEVDSLVGPKLDAFTKQIEVLERDLKEARAKADRAQALAERTRSGYVYIISNIGSFGEGVSENWLDATARPTRSCARTW